MKQTLLFFEPVPLLTVNRPSLTVTVRVPWTQREELVGVPETVRTPSTLIRQRA